MILLVEENYFSMKFLCVLAFFTIVDAKPNIIILVADDLGFNDLSFHGSEQIPTPNLDSLAKNGTILDNYYVCPVCSPSRGALMTGLYPIHTGLQHGPIPSSHPYGLSLKFRLLPEWLKNMTYDTHAIGKWHLGFFKKNYTPTFRGFDSHYGYWSGAEDYFDHTHQMGELWGLDFRHNMKSITDKLGQYSTSLYTEQAVHLIKNHNKSKPLFLYVAYQAVHSANSYSPLQAPEEYIKRFSYIEDKHRRVFAAMVSAMDDSVGKIVSTLNSQNMLDNSVILFTTDNGGPAAGFNNNAASNWPLRGVKATLWEGGVRGISFIWSSLLKIRRISKDLMHVTDWLPTLYRAAGGDVSLLGPLDGYDMWDTLRGNKPSPRSEVLLNIDPIHQNSALRVGQYKIIQGKMYDGNWNGWYGPSGRKNVSEVICGPKPANASTNCQPTVRPCLFNIEDDPCEYYNLAAVKPEILTALLKRLSEYNSTAVPPGNKPMDPMSNPKYHSYQWTHWMD
ncbi:arylsulfatase B isoform X2 [Parasteatoda tepidariorum]|uniref:arylsulfatase B isoform X2 n=2 Tax=Parasteatoda tepidariorum TaxID=114398 RepID=UPI001C727B07|nr:arylsulfatase B isoform X2 [Parasteatoda tepidariorum]